MNRNETLIEALVRLGLVRGSPTKVLIPTSAENNGYVRMAYEHADEDVTPTRTTTRIIEPHAQALNQLSWVVSLVSG